jgi:hypothetical protein
MPPTTTDRDPEPTLAAPCADCGTTAGGRDRRSARPVRKRGLCRNCYARHDHLGDILDFPRVLFDLPHDVCLGCGPINPREYIGRGLCCACLHRARRQGIVAEYPHCGPRPVPRPDRRIQPAHPAPLPAGLTPILRPDPTLPIWTGLAVAKYPQTTWHTYRREDRVIVWSDWQRQLDKAA